MIQKWIILQIEYKNVALQNSLSISFLLNTFCYHWKRVQNNGRHANQKSVITMGYITRMSYVVSCLRSRKIFPVLSWSVCNVNCRLTAYNTCLHAYYWYLGKGVCYKIYQEKITVTKLDIHLFWTFYFWSIKLMKLEFLWYILFSFRYKHCSHVSIFWTK